MQAHRFVPALGLALATAVSPPAAASPFRPLPATARGYPTPAEAFRMLAHRPDDRGWANPFRPRAVVPIRGGGFALLMAGGERDCHPCAATLAVAYFRRGGGGWRPAGQWDHVHEGGSWGEIDGLARLVLPGPDPLIGVKAGSTDLGCVTESMGVVELTPARPVERIDDASLGGGNGGAAPGPGAAVDISAVVMPLKGRPGLAIRYQGQAGRRRIDTVVSYSGPGLWRPHPAPFAGDCNLHEVRRAGARE